MAEEPAMESATENQNESVAPMPKPLNVSEAATNLKNLLDPQASETQEVASEESSKEVSDSETNIEETYDDPELIDQIEDETPSDTNQELYSLTVNGENVVSIVDVKLIRASGNMAYVSGLNDGDLMLTTGQAFVSEGEKITFEMQEDG